MQGMDLAVAAGGPRLASAAHGLAGATLGTAWAVTGGARSRYQPLTVPGGTPRAAISARLITGRPLSAGMRPTSAALDAVVPLRNVQEAASHADPRTTMRYDRARTSLDRHATYIAAAFIAGAAR
jgi:hypothetical protein